MKKYSIFTLLHVFIIFFLTYGVQKLKNPYYCEIIIFISFEVFGIMVFYSIKEYIISLENKINLYILFCVTLINTFIFIIALFVYFIIKKDTFYLVLSIVELFWFTIFLFFNLLSSSPDLGNYDINLQSILVVYILGIFLYIKLFKKNEKYKMKENKKRL